MRKPRRALSFSNRRAETSVEERLPRDHCAFPYNDFHLEEAALFNETVSLLSTYGLREFLSGNRGYHHIAEWQEMERVEHNFEKVQFAPLVLGMCVCMEHREPH